MQIVELFMIRYKRKYGPTWQYRPAVFQGEEGKQDAIRQCNANMMAKASLKLYTCEVVRLTPETVFVGIKSQDEL